VEFTPITENLKVAAGEYIFHVPTQQIVLCGSFSKATNTITGLGQQGMISDMIENYQKIYMSAEELENSRSAPCKGCGG
jgi:hypothetical protein